MGLSASQSRVLTLTARLSDLELKAQAIQHQKIRLSEQSTAASKKYMDALDAQKLKFNYYSTGSVDATIENITKTGEYRITDKFGSYYRYTDGTDTAMKDGQGNLLPAGWYLVGGDKIPTSKGKPGDCFLPNSTKEITSTSFLLEQLQMANLFIQKLDVDTGKYEDYSYMSSAIFTTEDDDTGVAQAEAEYEYAMSEIQSKDKRLDLDLDNINTEHSAIDTEMDSVKKVVEDNVGRTFKVFS